MVNALSEHLEVWVRREGKEYNMAFKGGRKISDLEIIGRSPGRNSGTTIRFWPDAAYFESSSFSIPKLLHVLKARLYSFPA